MKLKMNMFKNIKRAGSVLLVVLLLICQMSSVSAEVTLPEGTVAGLPEDLMALDSDGNSVSSSTGEYFFLVEGMEPLVDYKKDIVITNLRQDKSYHVYFYAEPLDKEGEIDLEEETNAVFTLDGQQVFSGKVTGESRDGGMDIKDTPVDLGLYHPGDSRKLTCTITWDGTSVGSQIDNGSRVIDADGEHIVREKTGQEYIHGQVRFRWIFYAAVEEENTPPDTGLFGTSMTIYIILLLLVMAGIITLLVLMRRRDRNAKRV